MATRHQNPRVTQHPRSDEYPFEVQRSGPRGMALWDACIRELTSEPRAIREDAAVMLTLDNWPALVAQLGPETAESAEESAE